MRGAQVELVVVMVVVAVMMANAAGKLKGSSEVWCTGHKPAGKEAAADGTTADRGGERGKGECLIYLW